MKFFHPSVTSISVSGVVLATKRAGNGFILEVEDDFKHVETLLSHGFTRLEEKAAALVRPRSAGTGTGSAGNAGQTPSASEVQPDARGSKEPPAQ